MDILLIDPNKKDSQKLKEIITLQNWAVDQCENGLQALNKIRHFNYDIIFTELYLPIIDGISLCTLIKAQRPYSKIIITTKETHYYKKIQAFHAGVDEYIHKPITDSNFTEKLKDVIVRNTSIQRLPTKLKTENLVLNLSTKEAYRFGDKIPLRKKEFNLLMFLMMREGEILNRHTIIEYVWKDSIDSAATNIVDVYMNGLRKKIDTKDQQKLIHTVHGVGYRFGVM